MKRPLIIFALASLALLLSIRVGFAQTPDFCANVTTLPRSECDALIDIYTSAGGDDWQKKEGWLTQPNPCAWYGVGCWEGRVTELSLRDNHLIGVLPPTIGALTALQSLDLADNSLSGSLPATIGTLVNLQGLNLRNNHLYGELPDELGHLTQLEWLYLSQNNFSGALPVSLTQLRVLHTLYVRETNLCEPLDTAFQRWLDGIPSLGRSEAACDCRYITEIPEGECKALIAIYHRTRGDSWPRRTNWLQTITPCGWEQIACQDGHVSAIALGNNGLQGQLPPEIGNLPFLQRLDLSHNALQGTLLPNLTKLTTLTYCDLSVNQFEGVLPLTIGQLQKLTHLDLSQNRLEGELPLSIGNLREVAYLDLSQNRFNGELPFSLGNLTHLTELNLSANQFHGRIPAAFKNLTRLGYLDLSATTLRGTLPKSFTEFPFLSTFLFHQTNLCTPSSQAFQIWLGAIDRVEGTNIVCPRTYQGLLPLLILLVIGGVVLLPAIYQASWYFVVEMPSLIAQQFPRDLLTVGVFAFSAEVLWNILTLFDRTRLLRGAAIGGLLALGYVLISRRTDRRVRVIWVGRIIGVLGSVFMAVFMLLTVESSITTAEMLSAGGYVVLLAVPVWFMTSGITTGGYLELIAEGLLLGSLWGMFTGGALGDFYCYHSATFYGTMSDILTYQVFSNMRTDDLRRFLANEMTGMFLFSLAGGAAGAITRGVLRRIAVIQNPVNIWLAKALIAILKREEERR